VPKSTSAISSKINVMAIGDIGEMIQKFCSFGKKVFVVFGHFAVD
jgi:hypothetical protein